MFNYGIIKCHSRQPSAHLAAPTKQVSFWINELGSLFHCGLYGSPYDYKIWREKTLTNWWKIWFSWRKLSRIAHFCRRTHLRIATKPRNPRKFSPLKVSRYTVHHSPSTNSFPPTPLITSFQPSLSYYKAQVESILLRPSPFAQTQHNLLTPVYWWNFDFILLLILLTLLLIRCWSIRLTPK